MIETIIFKRIYSYNITMLFTDGRFAFPKRRGDYCCRTVVEKPSGSIVEQWVYLKGSKEEDAVQGTRAFEQDPELYDIKTIRISHEDYREAKADIGSPLITKALRLKRNHTLLITC